MKQIINNTFSTIITAGGCGLRFDPHQKKQFTNIADKPILYYAIDIFYHIDTITEIIITLPEDELSEKNELIKQTYPQKVKCIAGGKTRQNSVYNALLHCDTNNKYVIIHDGVRPFLDKTDLSTMMEKMSKHKALIAASKIKNTIKYVKDDIILQTPDRNDIIEVYTPQIFNLSMITELHSKARDLDICFSDDASICEHFGEPVVWFDTTSPALKITTKDDLKYAQYIVGTQFIASE